MKKDRYYKSSKGDFVPSGTTVLPSPDLKQWAADCAVDYIIQDKGTLYCTVSETDETGTHELLEYMTYDIILAKARTAYQRESIQAADYGTYIHTLCQYSLTNNIKLESPHKLTQGFMDGLWAWKVKHSVKVIAMEHEVVTDTYGGRLDLVCEMDSFWMTKAWCKRYGHEWYKGIDKQRVIVLVDFKTGKDTYWDNWKYQLAGYRQAWNNWIVTVGLKLQDFVVGKIDKARHWNLYMVEHHGILKFNKKTGKVNYKDFTEYQATRPKVNGKFVNGKIETEKYTRNYETDRNTFNALTKLWWLTRRGIEI